MAVVQEDNASEPDGMNAYTQPIEIETIRTLLAQAGLVWRSRNPGAWTNHASFASLPWGV